MMLGEAVTLLPFAFTRRSRRVVVQQMYTGGIKTLGVVTVVALFTGMIMALQVGLELQKYGQEEQIGFLVSEVMIREMGPMMTGLIIAASVGSAMAARVATMTVSEEIAALEVMSINPVRFLVMPRVLALAIMVPVSTFYADLIGILGGAVVGATQLKVSLISYFDLAFRYTSNKGLYVGLFKGLVFGIVIATVACHQGLAATEGAHGVGLATRRTVIASFLVILILGYFITRLAYQ
jgi:phospholipid/cholesterol/gamma-HCH transport system permease protein